MHTGFKGKVHLWECWLNYFYKYDYSLGIKICIQNYGSLSYVVSLMN